MVTFKDDERSDRQKQQRHGAQSDQGGGPMKEGPSREQGTTYQGPEESNQQRRAEQTNQRRKPAAEE